MVVTHEVFAESVGQYELYKSDAIVQDDGVCKVVQLPDQRCYFQTPYGQLSRNGWFIAPGETQPTQLSIAAGAILYPNNGRSAVFMASHTEPFGGEEASPLLVTKNFSSCLQKQSATWQIRSDCFKPAHMGSDTSQQIHIYSQAMSQVAVMASAGQAFIYDGRSIIYSYGLTSDSVEPLYQTRASFKNIDPAYPPVITSAIGSDAYAISFPKSGMTVLSGLKACFQLTSIDNYPCYEEDVTAQLQSLVPAFTKVVATHFGADGLASMTAVTSDAIRYTISVRPRVDRPISLMGLGDSFAAGEGTYRYRAGSDVATNKCHNSVRSYAYLLGATGSIACAGARTRDFKPDAIGQYGGKKASDWPIAQQPTLYGPFTPGIVSQLDSVRFYQPEVATISVGGNDVGFGTVMRACLIPVQDKRVAFDCYPTYEDRLELLRAVQASFANLVKTYETLKSASPHTRFIVAGYPKLLSENGNCAVNVRLSDNEIRLANQWTDYLNATIEAASARAGVRYVPMGDVFEGYELCGRNNRTPAVNGITYGDDGLRIWGHPIVGQETYHPTSFGYYLMSERLRPYLTDKTTISADITRMAPPITDTQPMLQAPRSGRRINKVVHEPDLLPRLIDRTQTVVMNMPALGYTLLPHATYVIQFDDPVTSVATGIVPSDGRLEIPITIPTGVSDGVHTIHLRTTDNNGDTIDVTNTVDINQLQYDLNPVNTDARFSLSIGSIKTR